jgi:hypothetical protein
VVNVYNSGCRVSRRLPKVLRLGRLELMSHHACSAHLEN